jgi:hypothetical protein
MNKILYSVVLTGLLLIGSTTACNSSFIPTSQSGTETIPTIRPTETATLISTSTEVNTPVPATPEFAPLCVPGATSVPTPAQCRFPIAEEGGVFCSNKDPYNLILINVGAKYEVLTNGLRCSDAGMKADRQMVVCTGPMASPFEVRVCDPACAVPTVQADVMQCPQGFNFDNLQGCCTKEPVQLQQNCVTLKLETISCVVDCGEFTKKSACKDHSYACVWDSKAEVCQLRK